MATGANPGNGLPPDVGQWAASPITNIQGSPKRLRSGRTKTRPTTSNGTFNDFRIGDATLPAAQMTLALRINWEPANTPCEVTFSTLVFSITVTPRPSDRKS